MSKNIYFDDYSLVHRYLTGDDDAGRELYKNAYEPLLSYIKANCKGYGFSYADYEDIAEESMTRSVEKLSTYTGNSKFSTFLCGFAKNIIKEVCKKKGREVLTDFTDPPEDVDMALTNALSAYGILPEEYVIKKEGRELLWKILEQLKGESQDHYDIIQLRLINEWPYAQISQFTGETISALDSRYRRALRALKKISKNFIDATDFSSNCH